MPVIVEYDVLTNRDRCIGGNQNAVQLGDQVQQFALAALIGTGVMQNGDCVFWVPFVQLVHPLVHESRRTDQNDRASSFALFSNVCALGQAETVKKADDLNCFAEAWLERNQ